MTVSKDQWAKWRDDSVTQAYLAGIYGKREILKEGLVQGEASEEDQRSVVIGRCQGIQECIEAAVRSENWEFPQEEETKND